MRDAQTKLVAASREVQAAETALKDAGGPKRAPQDAVKRCTLARSSLLLARSEYGAAQSAKDAAEKAVTTTEVQLANQLKERNVINLLFKRKLTPEEEEEQRLQMAETRRIGAALTIQRNYRARAELKKQRRLKSERRKRALVFVFGTARSLLYAFLLYAFLAWARTEGRYAVARAKTRVYHQIGAYGQTVWDVSRHFAPLEHDYARYGVASGIEAGENVVLRKRNRELKDSVVSLESQLDSSRRALESTGGMSPCDECARDVAATREATARARVAEQRADALAVEVHALRSMATKCSASRSTGGESPMSNSESHPMRAWLDDPGASYSAQVAEAATAAASVVSEERVKSATELARAATEEADAARVEVELLRSLVDDGFLPGGSGGSGWGSGASCWAEATGAAAKARASTAKDAAAAAHKAANRLMDEKVAAYGAARREAEARADEYRIELDVLKAAGPELRDAADYAHGALDGSSGSSGSSSDSSSSSYKFGAPSPVPPVVVAHPDPRARLKIVGAAKLVAAAKVASERVAFAAEALRDAETRAEARRIEVETLEFLVGANGTGTGAVDRARGYVTGAPKAAEAARDTARALVEKRLRAEEEARTLAETRAEVYRVELATARHMEAERARAGQRKSAFALLPPGVTREGEVATLVKEVKRLEKELGEAKKSKASKGFSPPGSVAEAAAASTEAANAAAAEASAAAPDPHGTPATRSRKNILRRLAAGLISVVSGEPADLGYHNQLLERRITAMSRQMASAAGPACAAALSDAIDDRIDAERHAQSLQNELDAAQELTRVVAAESFLGGDKAAEALRVASDKHRMLLVKERHAAKAALETCRSHAAAAQQRAYASALAAHHAEELSTRRERELELERIEHRKDAAIRMALDGGKRRALIAQDGDDLVDATSLDDESGSLGWPQLPESVTALESAYEAARDDAYRLESAVETLTRQVRDAERRMRVAPGTVETYVSRIEPWGLFNYLVAFAVVGTLIVNRKVTKLAVSAALHKVQCSRAKARAQDLKVQLDVAVNTAAIARQRLYSDVSDEKAIGTTVDELRASIKAHSALNAAIREDNDGLRKQLLDASAFDSEAHYASVVEERHTSELLYLRAEVEKLRAARMDVAAAAASGAAQYFEERGDANKEGGATASHRNGVFAARDAAATEARLLREEANALRETNDALLTASEKLRLENHELLDELIEDGELTKGLSAYQAAKFLKRQAVEAGEQAAAERIARIEYLNRFTRLVAEAKNARYSTAFIFLGAAVAVALVTYAPAGEVVSVVTSLVPPPLRFVVSYASYIGAFTAASFALWAIAYSRPSPEAAAAMTPITRVALVDKDDVELVNSDWTPKRDVRKRGPRRTTPPSTPATPGPSAPTSTPRSTPVHERKKITPPPREDGIAERLEIRELQAAVVGADALMTKGSKGSWGAGLAEAVSASFKRPDEHPEAVRERKERDTEIARIRKELQQAKQHAARLQSGKPPRAARTSGQSSGARTVPSRVAMFGGGKEVILTEQEQRAAMAAAEASAREGSLQSQIDMLREKNELMSKEVTKLRRKAERAQGETEAARAEASLYTSIKPSPAVSMKTSGVNTPRSVSPATVPGASKTAPVVDARLAAVKKALGKKK